MTDVAPVLLDGSFLSLEDFERVCTAGALVSLGDHAREGVAEARAVVDAILATGKVVYGLNTGFGHLAHVRVAGADLVALQNNLIRSHCVGVGQPFDLPATRGIILLRANVLAAGRSGVRVQVLQLLLDFLNHRVHPIIPQKGSVGASGDLAPLAHLALALLGEGMCHGPDGPEPTAKALARAGLEPITLAPKEGLALINGTQAMTSVGALAVQRARRLAGTADVVGAMTVEAHLGSYVPFQARLHDLRPHPGQRTAAEHLRRLLVGGEINKSHETCAKVQDPYSMRCMPQVHGAARTAIEHAADVLQIELNSVTDNPTVFPDSGELVSGGNFHGQPVATVLDYLALGVAELGSISERRIEQLVNPRLSDLPAFLAAEPGLHSGFMMAQVTAASLASENKIFCHPASIDSIPTSANQEDHVSMGTIAARKALEVIENVERILAIEALVAAQALELRAPLRPAAGPEAALRRLRHEVAFLDRDRVLAPDLEAATVLVRSGDLLAAADAAI